MITDNPGSSFWQSVYSSALLEAKGQNAYVEMIFGLVGLKAVFVFFHGPLDGDTHFL